MKQRYSLALIVFLVGCATVAKMQFEDIYGKPNPTRFDQPLAVAANGVSFRHDVQPILNQRCVVCHACYDGPCQLKLTSWEGLARGASQEDVYATRLSETQPTRLGIDAQTPSEWRKLGFFPVLNEYVPTPAAALQASLLARAIELKDAHPLPANQVVSGDIDFSIGREQVCSPITDYAKHEAKNPQWGMPFGLPGLQKKESDTIKRWLQQGAPYDPPAPLSASTQRQIGDWEKFFNAADLRTQLVSRYIYEHLFLAHLYFDSEAKPQYFRMVRSTTPPGQPIKEIASRRPYDDPGAAPFYYRLRLEDETVVAKTHMPYVLNAARMLRWNDLFFKPNYQVSELPAYKIPQSANPFEIFKALPVQSRYEFMLDEAQFTVMGFIKGPVCRGQTALASINDQFWVFFQNPATIDASGIKFLDQESANLSTQTARTDDPNFSPIDAHNRDQQKFLLAKSKFLSASYNPAHKPTLDLIWDGNGKNPNAALTIYRHNDSATVLKGMVGDTPKTAWVIGYTLLERIHYLLVAGYDVFGSISHQLVTRLYMDSLRMEGEFAFIALLPTDSRIPVRDYWYRGADKDVKDQVYGKFAYYNGEANIPFPATKNPVQDAQALMEMMKARLTKVSPNGYALSQLNDPALEADLAALAAIRGKSLQWLPAAAVLRIEDAGKAPINLNLLRNVGHSNVTALLNDNKTALPEEDTLSVLAGMATAYPNAFYRIKRSQVAAFTKRLASLASEKDYTALTAEYGIRRSSPEFWAVSDQVNAEYAKARPIEAGVLDYNRLENR